jgi:hypothetical protein
VLWRVLFVSVGVGLTGGMMGAARSLSSQVAAYVLGSLMIAVIVGVLSALKVERLTASRCSSVFARMVSAVGLIAIVLSGAAGLIYFSGIVGLLLGEALHRAF